MKSLLCTLALTAYLGLTVPAYAQENEWQIGPAPTVEKLPERDAPDFQGLDRFLDYATFLAERVLEVREVEEKYAIQPIITNRIGMRKVIAETRSLTKTIDGLKWGTIEVDETRSLGRFLEKYRNARDKAEEQKKEAKMPKNPVPVTYTPMTCAESIDYLERLDQIGQEYNIARIQAIRADPNTVKNEIIMKLEDQLSNLLRTTRAQAKQFSLEHKCGVK